MKTNTVFSQNNHIRIAASRIDSLKTALKTAKDTNKVKYLNLLSWEVKDQNVDSSIALSKQALMLSEKLSFKKGIAQSYHQIGLGFYFKGNYDYALQYYKNCITACERIESFGKSNNEILNLKSKTLGYIGLVYSNKGNILKALDYYFTAIKIDEKTGNKTGIARHSGNIGIIYFQRNNIAKAKEYYLRALQLAEETGYKLLQANTYGNLGLLYADQNDKFNALDYYYRALKMADEEGYKQLQANTLGNIGDLYKKKGALGKAQDHYFVALKIKHELGDMREIAITLKSIAEIYSLRREDKLAEKYFLRASVLADSLEIYSMITDIHNELSRFYSEKKDYKNAYFHYVAAIESKDSVDNEQKQKEIIRKEMEFEYAKKAAADSIKNQEEKKVIAAQVLVRDEQLKSASIQRYALFGGLALMLVFGGFMFSRYKITQRQKKIIEVQKADVDEKNKEIMDSITYAKRLQEAILPSIDSVKKYLPDSFVYYKPKDIVAGDFYYFENSLLDENLFFLAAADCTGHGVPGALVSVVCSNALNRCVKELRLTDSGKILDSTRDLVLETFTKNNQEVRDGMDISFCTISIQKDKNKKTKLNWSGANNPLWYIQDGELKEISATKQPIGKTENPKPFISHVVELNKGDMFYLFTDGYADQFGGEKRKKFKYKPLKELLLEIHKLHPEEQHAILSQRFNEWCGDLEQVDDVCIVGVRI